MVMLTIKTGDDHELRWREGLEVAAKLLMNVNRDENALSEKNDSRRISRRRKNDSFYLTFSLNTLARCGMIDS